ncbi:23S rRNA (pseudouridine1915-N3)-methyltransferase [Methanolinea mesophila]|uniref:23S rRNA (pseudouridine(1915)-N(3))-methyltransferase RlmH n=1 Tax=Methanolinea mesophila TaxID=547055 RepID=UPI001FD87186|nr:23S rRNA (pseudouridine(1915)-N(3))-methyltransferase RlmH [Methanolinea mesophila]MBP1928611.1 23S rRNA (pseudouridine1915-N3)-methyltransferase [Methanolinea mesophila]
MTAMQIQIVAAGKIRESYLLEGIQEYVKRLRPYADLSIAEISEVAVPPRASPSEVRTILEREGERILAALREPAVTVALTPDGEEWTSGELAGFLGTLEIEGKGRVAFLIGGSLGLSPQVLSRAEVRLSLSRMTFPHQMCRLILLEQIYRAFRIKTGQPYHK